MDRTRKVKTFGTFLNNLKPLTPEKSDLTQDPTNRVLSHLGSTSKPMAELLKDSQLGILEFSQSLETLCTQGLVSKEQQGGEEWAKLTPLGEEEVLKLNTSR